MIESPFTDDNIKVVVFMETKPLSDHFEQIMFTKESYKKIIDAIEKEMRHEGKDFIVTTDDTHSSHFKDIKDYYTQEEIDEE